jgi:hypothetical protein
MEKVREQYYEGEVIETHFTVKVIELVIYKIFESQ